MRAGLSVLGIALLVFVFLPIAALLRKAVENRAGDFVGVANFERFLATPALTDSIGNSLFIATTATILSTLAAFLFAYGLTRTCMPGKAILTSFRRYRCSPPRFCRPSASSICSAIKELPRGAARCVRIRTDRHRHG